MVANIQKRGKSETHWCHISIVSSAVCPFICHVSSCHLTTSRAQESHCLVISSHRNESIHHVSLSFCSQEVTNGRDFSSVKLLHVTSSYIKQQIPVFPREIPGTQWEAAGCSIEMASQLRQSLTHSAGRGCYTHWLSARGCSFPCSTDLKIITVKASCL